MVIRYTARRSLIAGHVFGDEYTLNVSTTSLVHTSKVDKVTQRAIGGATETLYSRTDKEWSMTFEPLRGAQLAALIEFLDSTERGETFSLSLPGDSPAGTICRRTDDAYTLAEFLPLGNPSTRDWFQTSVTVREV